VRPAVSVGRTTALDGFDINSFSHLSNLGDDSLSHHDFGSYFDAPEPTESDNQLFEQRLAPLADDFNSNFDHLANHNDGVFENFNLDDFLHDDQQPATEIHASDPLAETTANLQPQLGASSYGCDSGGNAVSV